MIPSQPPEAVTWMTVFLTEVASGFILPYCGRG